MSTKITRDIIHIDEEKCDGCGLCVPACAEGAIQIIDGKARLAGERFCDGLGACLGDCPRGAITIEVREAEAFDAQAVEERLRSAQGAAAETGGPPGTITCASEVVFDREETKGGLAAAEAGTGVSAEIDAGAAAEAGTGVSAEAGTGVSAEADAGAAAEADAPAAALPSALSHWPVHLRLVPPVAKFLHDAHLLITADCVPFAFADFHRRFLKGKTLLVGCPKFDDTSLYYQKLVEIFENNNPKKITVLMMEVPCCSGLSQMVAGACAAAGKEIPLEKVVFTIDGKIKSIENKL